jgi:hypothetical protein
MITNTKIPAISVTNVRQGFVERADFEALVASLGELQGRGTALMVTDGRDERQQRAAKMPGSDSAASP